MVRNTDIRPTSTGDARRGSRRAHWRWRIAIDLTGATPRLRSLRHAELERANAARRAGCSGVIRGARVITGARERISAVAVDRGVWVGIDRVAASEVCFTVH